MSRVRKVIQGLPSKKQYFELVGAMLSIPVLITVILLNTNSLRSNNSKTSTPTPAVVITEKDRVITQPPQVIYQGGTSDDSSGSSSASCTKEVGQVRIASPREDEVVSTNPVCFDISSDDDSICPLTYAYRVDGGSWTDFSRNTVCLYNLQSGRHTVDVKVKSSQSDDVVQLRRTFQVGQSDSPSSTPTPTPVK